MVAIEVSESTRGASMAYLHAADRIDRDGLSRWDEFQFEQLNWLSDVAQRKTAQLDDRNRLSPSYVRDR